MIIQPYSDIAAFESGGRFAATAANYPSLKHYFTCDSTDLANNTLTDHIGDLVLAPASGSIAVNTNPFSLTVPTLTRSSGTVQSPGTKYVVLLWGGVPAATGSNLTVGSIAAATNRGFRSSAVTSTASSVAGNVDGDGDHSGVVTGTTTTLAGNGTQFQSRALVIKWAAHADAATGIQPYDVADSAAATARTAAGDLSLVTGITAIDQLMTVGAGCNPAYIQVWYFTVCPSVRSVTHALQWTDYAVSSIDDKFVYPGWSGV